MSEVACCQHLLPAAGLTRGRAENEARTRYGSHRLLALEVILHIDTSPPLLRIRPRLAPPDCALRCQSAHPLPNLTTATRDTHDTRRGRWGKYNVPSPMLFWQSFLPRPCRARVSPAKWPSTEPTPGAVMDEPATRWLRVWLTNSCSPSERLLFRRATGSTILPSRWPGGRNGSGKDGEQGSNSQSASTTGTCTAILCRTVRCICGSTATRRTQSCQID